MRPNKASEVVFMKLICMSFESKNHKSEIQNPLRILRLNFQISASFFEKKMSQKMKIHLLETPRYERIRQFDEKNVWFIGLAWLLLDENGYLRFVNDGLPFHI